MGVRNQLCEAREVTMREGIRMQPSRSLRCGLKHEIKKQNVIKKQEMGFRNKMGFKNNTGTGFISGLLV